MILAVTFDVGGTLASGELDRDAYVERVVSHLRGMGYPVTVASYRRALRPSMEKLGRFRSRGREMRFEDFYSEVLRRLHIPPTADLIDDIRHLYRLSFPQNVKEGVVEALNALRGAYRLAVISNSMSLLPKLFLEESGLSEYFEVVVISGEVGYRKPHPRIFQYALKRLGVRPWEAVHVGNSVREDVAGAKGVGMWAIWVRDEGEGDVVGVQPDVVVDGIMEVPRAVRLLELKIGTKGDVL